jgi:hypothetical protein
LGVLRGHRLHVSGVGFPRRDLPVPLAASVTKKKCPMLATKSDIAVLDAKIDKLSWMMGILIVIAIANFAKLFF